MTKGGIFPIKPYQTATIMPLIEEGLYTVMGTVSRHDSVESAKHRIVQGDLLVFLIIHENEYAGFLTVYPYEMEGVGYLHIMYMYVKPGFSKVINLYWPELEKYAKSFGLKGITFKTSRNEDAWLKRLSKIGFEHDLVQLYKEL